MSLVLNADNTAHFTGPSQPPSTITTDCGITLRVLSHNVAQKWLSCMLSAYGSKLFYTAPFKCSSKKGTTYRSGLASSSRYPPGCRPAVAWAPLRKGHGRGRELQINFGGPGSSQFFSVSAVLIKLFHRLRALQVGTVPFTTDTYKPWTFIFGNSADPLWAPRRTLTGHSNGMKSCTLGTNNLFWFVLETGITRKRGWPAYTSETALNKYSVRKGFDNCIVEVAAYDQGMLVEINFIWYMFFFALQYRWSGDFGF